MEFPWKFPMKLNGFVPKKSHPEKKKKRGRVRSWRCSWQSSHGNRPQRVVKNGRCDDVMNPGVIYPSLGTITYPRPFADVHDFPANSRNWWESRTWLSWRKNISNPNFMHEEEILEVYHQHVRQVWSPRNHPVAIC